MSRKLILEKGIEIFNNYLMNNNTDIMPKDLFIEKMADLFEVLQENMKYRLKNII